jgi:hypothetical protein
VPINLRGTRIGRHIGVLSRLTSAAHERMANR